MVGCRRAHKRRVLQWLLKVALQIEYLRADEKHDRNAFAAVVCPISAMV